MRPFVLAPLVCVLACSGRPAGPATTTADVTSTGDGEPRWTTDLMVPTTGGTTTGGAAGPDLPAEGYLCDPRIDDCPDGFKCTPFAAHGGDTWDGTRCVPLAADPAGLGEPCHAEEYTHSGIDDCGPGLLCWYFNDTSERLGRCLGLCGLDDTCVDPDARCFQSPLPSYLCIPLCDPLAQDCPPPATLCVRDAGVDGFMCRYPPAGAPAGAREVCERETDCAAGHVCDPAGLVGACEGAAERCCAPVCSLSQPACALETPTCVPFEPDPQPRYADVGICHADVSPVTPVL